MHSVSAHISSGESSSSNYSALELVGSFEELVILEAISPQDQEGLVVRLREVRLLNWPFIF